MIVTDRRINLLQAWKRAGPPAPRTITELQMAGAWGTRTTIMQAFRRMGRAEPGSIETRIGPHGWWQVTFTPMGVAALGHIPTRD